MLPPVFQALKASAAVTNIVGSQAPRIYRHGRVPDDLPRPIKQAMVTWFLVSGVPENNLSDPPPCDRATVQVDCWHPTDAGIELLSVAVRNALEQIGVMTGTLIDEFETEAKLYRLSMQVDIFNNH